MYVYYIFIIHLFVDEHLGWLENFKPCVRSLFSFCSNRWWHYNISLTPSYNKIFSSAHWREKCKLGNFSLTMAFSSQRRLALLKDESKSVFRDPEAGCFYLHIPAPAYSLKCLKKCEAITRYLFYFLKHKVASLHKEENYTKLKRCLRM